MALVWECSGTGRGLDQGREELPSLSLVDPCPPCGLLPGRLTQDGTCQCEAELDRLGRGRTATHEEARSLRFLVDLGET